MSSLTAKDLGLSIDVEEEPLDVLDLPQLYTRPSTKTLLTTLADLSSEPASWSTTPRSGSPGSKSGAATPARKRKIRNEGVPAYLTQIISSRLNWIDNDDEKESVWEAASQRMSERSGRTAMGDISRTFSIPIHSPSTSFNVSGDVEVDDPENVLSIDLREPALTADNLGFKTWASSFLLAKRLSLITKSLPRLGDGVKILELGAGTGLVGMAAAAIFQTHVILTDLPEIVPNLEHNARTNAAVVSACGGRVNTAVLDWSKPSDFTMPLESENTDFLVILAADPLYSTEHPKLLSQAIDAHLSRSKEARVVLELPLREAYVQERKDLRSHMSALGLHIIEEGEETGFDDWSSGINDEELTEVRCWWSIWGWQQASAGKDHSATIDDGRINICPLSDLAKVCSQIR